MARAIDPTVCRRRLARMLRDLREAAGMTAEEAGKRLEWSKGKISRIESGQFKLLRLVDVRSALDLYGVTEGSALEQRQAILELARQSRQKGWWEQWSDVLKDSYPGFEAEATLIVSWHPLVLPGLFQTAEYSRALIHAAGVSDEREIERRIELRLRRQQILRKRDALRINSIIGEEALLRPWGRPGDRAAQVQQLIDVAGRDDIELRILPIESGLHAGLGGSFVILGFSEDPSIVYLETGNQGIYLERPDEVRHYQALYDSLTGSALSIDDSRTYLRCLIERPR